MWTLEEEQDQSATTQLSLCEPTIKLVSLSCHHRHQPAIMPLLQFGVTAKDNYFNPQEC
jgi:hypothetical protein